MTHTRNPRVFVTQGTSRLNLAKAHKHGELVELLPEGTHVSLNTQPALRQLKLKLHSFGDSDFILPLGDPAVIVMAGIIAAEANRGKIRLLKWDQKLKDYYSVQIDIFDRMKEIEA